MKRTITNMISCIFLLTLCLFCVPLKADAAAMYGDWEYTYNSTGITIVKYHGKVNYGIGIPQTIDGRPVTIIGSGALSGQSNLWGVTIPKTVTVLDNGAFCNTRLTSVEVPASVTKLGYGVFSSNPYLNSIVFRGNPTSMYEGCLGDDTKKTIRVYRSASRVISYCSARSNRFTLDYMKTETEIAAEKENAQVPNEFTVTDKYGTWTFDRTTCTIVQYSGKAKDVTVPEVFTYGNYRYQVKKLGNRAIQNNSQLQTLTINTPYIDTEAVYKNPNLTTIYVQSAVGTLGPYCFYFNDSLNCLHVSGNPAAAISCIPNRQSMKIWCSSFAVILREYCYHNNIPI